MTKRDKIFIERLNKIIQKEIDGIGVGAKTAIDREKILWFLKKQTPIPY
jgi:hypothetical protein